MKKTRYCSKCGKQLIFTTGSYCKICSAEYYKIYRSKKKFDKKEPNINVIGLNDFVEKIVKNNYYIDFNDISTIIFFYQIITIDIYEYNKYSSGTQIKMMWDCIFDYYNKKMYKQKNI